MTNNPLGFEELEYKFKEQVEIDKQKYLEFIRQSTIYLPNPCISTSPKFVVICMEPSFSKDLPKLNFMKSKEDFILHYCAYKYLCLEHFEYYITDISKGAMPVKIASIDRKYRYDSWLPLLERELDILKCSKCIAIGKPSHVFLKKNIKKKRFKFPIYEKYLLHFSGSNKRHIRDYLIKNNLNGESIPTTDELNKFVGELYEHINYPENIRKTIFNKPLSKDHENLIKYYKSEFKQLLQS